MEKLREENEKLKKLIKKQIDEEDEEGFEIKKLLDKKRKRFNDLKKSINEFN